MSSLLNVLQHIVPASLVVWFANLSIKRKLSLVLGVALFAVVGVGATALIMMRFVVADVRDINNNWLPSVEYASAMFADVIELRAKEYKYCLSASVHSPEQQAVFEAEMDTVIARYKRHESLYVSLISSEHERALYLQAQASMSQYLASNHEFRALMQAGRVEDANYFLYGPSLQAVRVLRSLFEQLIELNIKGGNVAAKASERTFTQFFVIVSVVVFLSFGAVGVLSVWMAALIIRPLRRLERAAQRVAQGDVHQLVETTTQDETGSLTLSFNTMVRALRNSLDERKANEEQLSLFNEQLGNEIEQRLMIEQALIRAKSNADAANLAKSEFLANMSHEIRTPMNAILGFASLMSEQTQNEKHRFYLHAISSSGNALLQILNDILDLSKIEAGRLDIRLAAVNPYRLFQEVYDVMRFKVQEKRLDFETDIDSTLPEWLLLDDVRLRQVLLNLLSNAVKFTHQGSVRMRVRSLYPDDDRSKVDIIIQVEDTGIGIPSEQHQRVFEPFRQQESQNTKQYGGTGLGLSICQRLVQMMGGSITLTSAVGMGSTFAVTLHNVDVASAAPSEAETSEVQAFMQAMEFEPATVMIVDDIPLNRRLLIDFLEGKHLRLVEASNGREALKLAASERPDAILMDIKMNDMNGYEALTLLRVSEQTCAIPVIAATASVMKEDAERVLQAGFDGMLHKPIRKVDVLKELSRFLPYRDGRDVVQAAMLGLGSTAYSDAETNISKHGYPAQSDDWLGGNIIQSPQAVSSPSLPDSQPLRHHRWQSSQERSAELLRVLQSEYLPQWEQIHTSLKMSKIEIFATNLLALSEQFRIQSLQDYAATLLTQKRRYDVVLLPKTLAYFPDLVDGIRRFFEEDEDEGLQISTQQSLSAFSASSLSTNAEVSL
jgi:signal transduction histidine kinase/CheY-like chemotaxis protein